MNESLKSGMLERSREIAKELYDGNDVSQRMGRMLNIMMDVLEKSNARFEHMRGELESVYGEMSRAHNKIFQQMGGTLGSGEFITADVKEAQGRSSFNFEKLTEGLSVNGFMLLQISNKSLRELKMSLGAFTPMKSPELDFVEKVEFAQWVTFLSLYESSHRDRVLKILSKYDPKAS